MNFYSLTKGYFFLLGLITAGFSSAETRLTTDGSNKRDPVFIDGGATLVYGVDENRDLIRLKQLDLDTLESKPYYESANRHHVEVAIFRAAAYFLYRVHRKPDGSIRHQGSAGEEGLFVKHGGRRDRSPLHRIIPLSSTRLQKRAPANYGRLTYRPKTRSS